jgi:hypothetical protein
VLQCPARVQKLIYPTALLAGFLSSLDLPLDEYEVTRDETGRITSVARKDKGTPEQRKEYAAFQTDIWNEIIKNNRMTEEDGDSIVEVAYRARSRAV